MAELPDLTAKYRQRPRRKTGPLSYCWLADGLRGLRDRAVGIERLRGCPQSKHQVGRIIQTHRQMRRNRMVGFLLFGQAPASPPRHPVYVVISSIWRHRGYSGTCPPRAGRSSSAGHRSSFRRHKTARRGSPRAPHPGDGAIPGQVPRRHGDGVPSPAALAGTARYSLRKMPLQSSTVPSARKNTKQTMPTTGPRGRAKRGLLRVAVPPCSRGRSAPAGS